MWGTKDIDNRERVGFNAPVHSFDLIKWQYITLESCFFHNKCDFSAMVPNKSKVLNGIKTSKLIS